MQVEIICYEVSRFCGTGNTLKVNSSVLTNKMNLEFCLQSKETFAQYFGNRAQVFLITLHNCEIAKI